MRAARRRGRGIVQLVREPGRQLAERDHLFVLQVVRREPAHAIDHHVHQSRRERRALPDHLGKVLSRDHKEIARLVDDGIAAWRFGSRHA